MASKDWNNMLAGRLYNAQDSELTAGRLRARKLLFRYNQSSPEEESLRREVARELFDRMGDNCYLEPPLRCDYGTNIRLGDRVYANFNLVVLDCATVTIGNDVLIGPNVGIYTATHPVDPGLRRDGLEFALPVTIEDGVWIGGHTAIGPGVRIGRNSVIGAGSVVTKDIPANVVAVGNPCRVMRPVTEKDREIWGTAGKGDEAASSGTESNSPA